MNPWSDVPLLDAHNHLQDAWLLPHRARVFEDLRQLPLTAAVVNGTCESDWAEVRSLAREHPFIRPSFGLHPWNVGHATSEWRARLVGELDHTPRGVIGEIGLDRWILDRAKPDDHRLAGLQRASLEAQQEAFSWQLALAAERELPATVHCLDAWGPLLRTLQTSPRPRRGFLLHAFGGSIEAARECAALGAYFSFNGYFLGERHAAKRAVFAALPADRLLVETDAPAMPLPAARRAYSLPGFADGNPINHPGNIASVYAGLAELRGISIDALARIVAENYTRLFGS